MQRHPHHCLQMVCKHSLYIHSVCYLMSILSGTQMAWLQCYKILLVCARLCKTFHPRRENNLLVSNSTCSSLYQHTNAVLSGLIAYFGTSALAQFGESWRNGWPVKTGDANVILKSEPLQKATTEMVTNIETDAVFQIVVIGWKVVWNGWNGVLSGGAVVFPPTHNKCFLSNVGSQWG